MAEPDPYAGVFRWAWSRAREHFRGVVVGVGLLTLFPALFGAVFQAAPNETVVDGQLITQDPSLSDRLVAAGLSALVGVGAVIVVVVVYALTLGLREQRNVLRSRLRVAGLPQEARDATARECALLGESINDFLAEAMRTKPLTAAILDEGDLDQAWRDGARRRLEHEQKTAAGFQQRFLPRIISAAQGLATLGVLSEHEKSSILWVMEASHDFDRIAVLLVEKARLLGWKS